MGMAIGPFERAQLLCSHTRDLMQTTSSTISERIMGRPEPSIPSSRASSRRQSKTRLSRQERRPRAGTRSLTRSIRRSGMPMQAWRDARRNHGQLWCRPVRTGCIVNPVGLQPPPRARDRPPRLRLRTCHGTAVGFSFFSHSIYGGGGPGVFNGNHVVTRHAPCRNPVVVQPVHLMQGPRCSVRNRPRTLPGHLRAARRIQEADADHREVS